MVVEKHKLIILSKLQAPQIKTKILHRKRLLDLLSENLEKKVILLCAGAGYGKTTLLSQFLSSKKIAYVYYHLEKGDAEPAVFLSYLIAGIRKSKPEFGKKTEKLSHFFNFPQRYLEVIAGTFINEIIECITQDLFIILEDYHELHSSEQIDRFLGYMLEHMPQQLHFIITSRTTPLIFPLRFKARDEIFEINSRELKFTKEEIKHLFEKVYSMSLKEREIKWIEEHSEGWPTSLRLMLQSSNYLEGIKSSDYVRRVLDSYHRSQANLFNYFAQEIYSKELKVIQQFLVDCSILEWLTPELCNVVTRRVDSENILSRLTTRNAFLFKIPGMGYRFHNLFKDFLQSKFIDITRMKRIYRRAGLFYARGKNLEQALKFFLEAEEYKKVASIIEKIGRRLTEQGKSNILCSYIEQLPQPIQNQRPKLLMNYVQSLIYVGRAEEAKLYCFRAMKLLKKSRKNRTKYAEALYTLGGIYLNEGKYNVAKKWLLNALEACPKSSKLTRASILNSIGSVHNEIGGKHLRKAVKYFKNALQIAQRNKYKELKASILNNWAWNELKLGNLHQAYSKYSNMIKLLGKYYSFGCGAGFYNATQINLLLGHKKEARAILDLGIKTCGAHIDLWSMARLWHGYALLYEELGDIKKAKQYISKSLEIYEKLSLVRLIINALNEMSKMDILIGNLSFAWRNLSAVWWFKKKRDDVEAIPILLTEAKLKMAQGKFEEAEDILLKELKLTQKTKQIFDSFLITIELIKVYHMQGKTQKSLEALKEAIMMSRTKGYNYLLLKELYKEKWMLPLIKKENIEKTYVVSLIKKSQLDIHWTDAFLFGVPKVIVDDCKIEERTWKTVKAKKLFFYLLLNKNENVSQDSLINTLWQNASQRTGRSNLRKTIQYIRETIKSCVPNTGDIIVANKGLYRISPHVTIELDTEEFQNMVNKAKTLKIQDDRLREHLQRAIFLHKDGFAIGWYDRWVEDMRHYYENLYEDCLNMMARYYFKKKRFKQASIWYKKLLSLNFYDEENHRRLMMVYAQLGKNKEIIQDFETLKKVLKKELNAAPQQTTIKLYTSLVK